MSACRAVAFLLTRAEISNVIVSNDGHSCPLQKYEIRNSKSEGISKSKGQNGPRPASVSCFRAGDFPRISCFEWGCSFITTSATSTRANQSARQSTMARLGARKMPGIHRVRHPVRCFPSVVPSASSMMSRAALLRSPLLSFSVSGRPSLDSWLVTQPDCGRSIITWKRSRTWTFSGRNSASSIVPVVTSDWAISRVSSSSF
jgi:hypothetical protein